MLTETHKITCGDCNGSFLYEFSSEKVKNYGILPIEDIQPGKIFFGVIPTVICKSCGRRIQISTFKPYNKLKLQFFSCLI